VTALIAFVLVAAYAAAFCALIRVAFACSDKADHTEIWVITCPAMRKPALVHLGRDELPAPSAGDSPALMDCTFWPSHRDCDRSCLRAIGRERSDSLAAPQERSGGGCLSPSCKTPHWRAREVDAHRR
jgi:hypothetical protein